MQLASGYTAEFCHCGKQAWYDLIRRFADANLYQTWSYDMVRSDYKRVQHFILRKNDAVVSAAQIRITQLFGARLGIAYIFWGPLWRLEGSTRDIEVFRQAIRALRNELSVSRRLVLRLYPMACKDTEPELAQVLCEEGYRPINRRTNKRTLIMDLRPSLENLRSGLEHQWPRHLKRAEKNELTMIFGEDESLFDKVASIYDQMVKRKGLLDTTDIGLLKTVQRDLPSAFKMKVVVSGANSEFSAGAIFSAMGDTAIYLVGATNEDGMRTQGSYLVHWAFVKWVRENGFLLYDLNGINPLKNAGTYYFKKGLAGRWGREVERFGKYQVADSMLSSIVVTGGGIALWGYKAIRHTVSTLQKCLRTATAACARLPTRKPHA